MSERIKILFLVAEPKGSSPLRLGQEIRDVEEKLRTAPKGRSFKIIQQWATRAHDLTEMLMIHRPTVVHFSGHAVQGKLVLENKMGTAQEIRGAHLANLLAGFSDTIRLVVLNACFTASEFDVLGDAIDYTVGTTERLSDDHAIRFSACFYQALAFGHSVPKAFELAKRQITAEGLPNSDVFSLLVREGVDTSAPFVRPRAASAGAARSVAPTRGTGRTNRAASHVSPAWRSQPAVMEENRGNRSDHAVRNSSRADRPPAEGTRSLEQVPHALQESLAKFRRDHPDPRKVAFLMMRFGNTKAHKSIVAAIRTALDPLGITVVRADDKQYHDDLFPNVLTYIHGCGFGIAVFERIETEQFNPNVALEVGYMFALKKDVCLLKDKTLNTLHADLVGKLYRVFDALDPGATIPGELSRWLGDKGLGKGVEPAPPEDG